jgi:hypothetical protein
MISIEKHLKGDPELMKGLNIDFAMHKKSDCDDNKARRISKTAKGDAAAVLVGHFSFGSCAKK